MTTSNRPPHIDFEDDFKKALDNAEKPTKIVFKTMRGLIDEKGGVKAARIMLTHKEKFSQGFKRLYEAGMLEYALESLVVKYENAGLFTPEEVETAKWRLANAELAKEEGDA